MPEKPPPQNNQTTANDAGEWSIACEDKLDGLLAITEDLININDISMLLDKILGEARKSARADAGSIFLVEQNKLRFSYVHNDTLFTDQISNKYHYVDFEMPIDETSLAGYVAKTGQSLLIDDVYCLCSDKPYCFNRSYDEASGYRTKSVLVVPMQTSRGKIVGVLQIINAKNDQGQVVPFSERNRAYVAFFANNAALAVERAMMTRELILRMIRMAELRDPKETGAHVNRVAAYCAEIYQSWATAKQVDSQTMKKTKDLIRVAAMLHDVGKVAISDTILKKPGRLTPEEFHIIKYHTIYAAQLFKNGTSDLDNLALEISLNHHERWDGTGYPGQLQDFSICPQTFGPGKKGESIPLPARIAALADVYDALTSVRTYKPPWPEDKVLATIKEECGSHFDPEVVDAFFAIYEVIHSIRQRYREE
jgi:HD-GYP domain-containing protein (c-di-GMP phosphodiesterase class II)